MDVGVVIAVLVFGCEEGVWGVGPFLLSWGFFFILVLRFLRGWVPLSLVKSALEKWKCFGKKLKSDCDREKAKSKVEILKSDTWS